MELFGALRAFRVLGFSGRLKVRVSGGLGVSDKPGVWGLGFGV